MRSSRRASIAIPPLPAALAAASIAAACLAGCASRPEAAPAALPCPSATLTALPVRLLDQNRAVLRLEARVRNPRGDALAVEAAECAVALEGMTAPLAAAPPAAAPPAAASIGAGSRLEAGSDATIAFELALDARELDESVRGGGGPAEAKWCAAARVLLRAPDGAALECAASADGAVPIVREPILRITSLRIERDVLVTTNLGLGLEIANPNAFPLEMRSISYDFYGEGKLWASRDEAGAGTGADAIPAKGEIERALRFTMNFADSDRRLFDLVARLRTVRYRLAGRAEVGTGLEAIPSFTLAFDLEGACPVEE